MLRLTLLLIILIFSNVGVTTNVRLEIDDDKCVDSFVNSMRITLSPTNFQLTNQNNNFRVFLDNKLHNRDDIIKTRWGVITLSSRKTRVYEAYIAFYLSNDIYIIFCTITDSDTFLVKITNYKNVITFVFMYIINFLL